MGVRFSFVSGLIGGGIICGIIGAERGKWFRRRHHLRHYRDGTQQMVPKATSSAALSGRNATDSSEGGIICSIIGTERSRWFRRRHYLQHYRDGTRQIVPETALSAALSGRNAADGSEETGLTTFRARSGFSPAEYYGFRWAIYNGSPAKSSVQRQSLRRTGIILKNAILRMF